MAEGVLGQLLLQQLLQTSVTKRRQNFPHETTVTRYSSLDDNDHTKRSSVIRCSLITISHRSRSLYSVAARQSRRCLVVEECLVVLRRNRRRQTSSSGDQHAIEQRARTITPSSRLPADTALEMSRACRFKMLTVSLFIPTTLVARVERSVRAV